MSNYIDRPAERGSVLGTTLVFKGDLSADEDLLILGRVEGSIKHTQRLTIGEQGTVSANIEAKFITVEGTVTGDLRAETSLLLKETAKIRGNIYAPSLVIAEGARFSGNIDMGGQSKAETKALPAPRLPVALAAPANEANPRVLKTG
jgi:cytoskeletal protein CcmA (bactofilin family)